MPTAALAALLLALQQPKTPAPRLVVMIAVDQLIPEQLQRLEARFAGGFRRFLDEGAVFWRATVDYHFAPDIMAYATASKAYRAGSYSFTILQNVSGCDDAAWGLLQDVRALIVGLPQV